MKIGVLADIHGNRTALEAVLEDCRQKNVTHYILLGDLFAKGSDPEGVFLLLKNLDVIASVRGNTDNWLLLKKLTSRQRTFVNYALGYMSQDALEAICKMPFNQKVELFGQSVILTHHYEKISGQQSSVSILTAHTHIAELRTEKEKIIFNPGSIGIPYDDNNCASYGIIEAGMPLKFKMIRVAYDVQKEVRLAKERNIPYLTQYIHTVTYGCKG